MGMYIQLFIITHEHDNYFDIVVKIIIIISNLNILHTVQNAG